MIRTKKYKQVMGETFYLSTQGYLGVLRNQALHSGKVGNQHNSEWHSLFVIRTHDQTFFSGLNKSI
jgi:hypothetical protein